MMSLVKRIFGKDAPTSADSQSQSLSQPAASSSSEMKPVSFDNDADFISFDTEEVMPGLSVEPSAGASGPDLTKGINIKGRAPMEGKDREDEEDDMDIDGGSSSDDNWSRGVNSSSAKKNGQCRHSMASAFLSRQAETCRIPAAINRHHERPR
jgi:hypothetical protein